MKIGFYVNNSRFSSVDCRHIANGNPGIGGTPYLIILIASQLSKRDNGLDITLFVDTPGMFPEDLKIQVVDNIIQCVHFSDINTFDYLIINAFNLNWSTFPYNSIKNSLKLIPWCHNFCPKSWLDVFADEPKIAKFITVGREELDLIRDHRAFSKGEYIYNCVPFDTSYIDIVNQSPLEKRNHVVVYVGSLVWGKCFHVLASLWPKILSKVPDAELYVIGSGQLYDKNVKLGKFQLAEKNYEDLFIKYLLDPKGEILSSVHFMGNMGPEKKDIIKLAKVGVPNPLGLGETFCISAVEMQMLGCVVTALEAPGYYDTFFNGVLVKNEDDLVRTIVELLNSSSSYKNYDTTLSYFQDNFSLNSVLKDWESLLSGDVNEKLHPILPLVHPNYRYKTLKEMMRNLKRRYSFIRKFIYIDYFIDFKIRFYDKFNRFLKL